MTLPSDKAVEELRKFIEETWTLVDGTGGGSEPPTSNLPGGLSSLENDRELTDDELAQDHFENYRIKLTDYQPMLSAVIDEPDFQPISFLQSGLNRGQAVCRISIHYSDDKLKKIIECLRKNAQPLKDTFTVFQESHVFNPLEELKAIFALPDDFFYQLGCTRSQLDSTTYLKALDLLDSNVDKLLKLNPFPLGTGFLVGENYLLTNHHVLRDATTALQCVAQFGYEDGAGDIAISEYEFDPRSLFITDPALDYTLIQLKPDSYTKRAAGYKFDWIDLVESEEQSAAPLKQEQIKILIDKLTAYGYKDAIKLPTLDGRSKLSGDQTLIIEHPRGRRKEIVLTNNGITRKTFSNIAYTTDTDYGSSGSPVFNMNWQLIAITKRVVPKIVRKRKSTAQQLDKKLIWRRFIASEGTRIIRIIEDLKKKSAQNSRLQNFIENFVTTSEQLNYPPLPSALRFDGVSNYIDISPPEKAVNAVDDFEQFTVEAWVNPRASSTDATIFSQVCIEPWYEEFTEEHSVFGRYLLSLKITPERNVVFTREPFWKISSTNFPDKDFLYPWIGKPQENKKSSLVILAQGVGDAGEKKIEIKLDEEEKIKALQCILYCLGFFNAKDSKDNKDSNDDKAYNYYQPENYKENYAGILSGKLDEKTKAAIERFNEWNLLSEEESKIPLEVNSIIIQSGAISIFERRGTYLGLGTKKPKEQLDNFKDHHGLRILELQYCLRSLDWSSPFLQDQQPPGNPDIHLTGDPNIHLTGRFDWPRNLQYPTTNEEISTTAYIVSKLQRAFHQAPDGVFGTSALSALEQAKSYKIRTLQKLPIGEFSHVAVTFNGTEIKIYINGQLANRRYTGLHSVGHIDKAFIGAKRCSPILDDAKDAYFRGSIAEVRLWKTSLQREEIASRMYRRLSGSELVDQSLMGYWRLEEGKIEDQQENQPPQDDQKPEKDSRKRLYSVDNLASQNLVYADESELQIQETSQISILSVCDFPAIPFAVGLKVSRAVKLTTASQGTAPEKESGITVECWVKFGYENGDIISGKDNQKGLYILRWINGKLQLELSLKDKDLKDKDLVTKIETQQAIPTTRMWHHIAFSWCATSKEVNLYLDGKLQTVTALQAQVKTLSYNTSYKPVAIFAAERFAINPQTIKVIPTKSKNDEDQKPQLHCSIAELRIWQVVRSHSEIKINLNERLRREEEAKNGLVGYWRFDGEENFICQSDYCEIASEPQEIPERLELITPQSKTLRFTDILDKDWAGQFISGLQEAGLIGSFFSEINPVQFRPNEPMKKQEFATLLINAFGGEPNKERANTILQFKDKDIEQSEYFADIEYVWRLGLISGDGEKPSITADQQSQDTRGTSATEILFCPKRPVNRGEVVAALFDSLRVLIPKDDNYENVLKGYDDYKPQAGRLVGWIPCKLIAIALQQGLIVNKTPNASRLDLTEEVTRAEIAAMLYQALAYHQALVHQEIDHRFESDHILKVLGAISPS